MTNDENYKQINCCVMKMFFVPFGTILFAEDKWNLYQLKDAKKGDGIVLSFLI